MFNLFKPNGHKKSQKRKATEKEMLKKALEFNYGEQDQVDFISYSGLLEESSYLQM